MVTQRLSFFRNPLTNVEDSVLIEYDIYNDGGGTKNIGLRIMMDTMLGKNDAAPFRIGNDAIVAEMAYSGEDIMDYWQSFDSLVSPNIIAQGIFTACASIFDPARSANINELGALADNAYRVKVKKDGHLFGRVRMNPIRRLLYCMIKSHWPQNVDEVTERLWGWVVLVWCPVIYRWD